MSLAPRIKSLSHLPEHCLWVFSCPVWLLWARFGKGRLPYVLYPTCQLASLKFFHFPFSLRNSLGSERGREDLARCNSAPLRGDTVCHWRYLSTTRMNQFIREHNSYKHHETFFANFCLAANH